MLRFSRLLVLFGILALVSGSATATDLDFALKLRTGEFTPPAMESIPLAASNWQGRHVLVQFDGPITNDVKARARSLGLELLDYVPQFAFTARMTQSVSLNELQSAGIRWIGPIEADQKISPWLSEYGFETWARRGESDIQYVVVLHRDVDAGQWAEEFKKTYGAQIIGIEPSVNSVDLITSEQALTTLSEYDEVLWIEQAPPPPETNNNDARANLGVDELFAAPYGLTGLGITAGEWDAGRADVDHIDLGNLISGDFSSFHYHATHVAGTVVGTGTGNSAYRGMAPAAQLITYQWWSTASEMATEYQSAITSRGMLVATNSWGYGVGDPATQSACENLMGNYISANSTIDNLVRGSAGAPVTIFWSAGNQRGNDSKYCGSLGWTYNTVGGLSTSKNIVSVGAINSNNNTMTSFSSWGPIDDGRLKPDVVGPGCQSSSDWGVTSTKVGGGYQTLCGTSMSTPAVAGVALLMHEQFEISFPGQDILPSTVKGILVNTADDLGRPGPDYQYGHGKVDAVEAIDKIPFGENSWVESQIETGQTFAYTVTVPGDADKLKITLVWDDPGGIVNSTLHLINDLDLVLEDPFGVETYPWVLDPAVPGANATRDVDRLNNVLTCEVDNPSPGLWTARVSGHNIPNGPQTYSLIFTPDNSHTPGSTGALSVFDNGAAEANPSELATAEFWVTNIGASEDTVDVDISDALGWLVSDVVDSVVVLDVWDSAYFSVQALIPSEALAGDASTITCSANSLVGVASTTREIDAVAAAVFASSLSQPPGDTVNSPDVFNVSVSITNVGNIEDDFTITPTDEYGWSYSPPFSTFPLAVDGNQNVMFQVTVPAEVPDQFLNTVSFLGTSTGGAYDSVGIEVLVNNPLFPPTLMSPAEETYSQDRVHTFEWSGSGDSYKLIIDDNSDLSSPILEYPGLTENTFTMPSGDALADGIYYWGVRLYTMNDSSSLQLTPYLLGVDNEAPVSVSPVSPDGGYESEFPFDLVMSLDGPLGTAVAPEVIFIELASDAGFTQNIQEITDVEELTYTVESGLPQGQWFWRTLREDFAGNASAVSTSLSFILDSEAPVLPTQLQPAADATVDKDTMVFKWAVSPDPGYVTAPEYYIIQIFGGADFSGMVGTYYSYGEDSLVYAADPLTDGEDYFWRVKAIDSAGHYTDYTDLVRFVYQPYECGNIDGTPGVDIGDLTAYINYLFLLGAEPDPVAAGAIDCDNEIDISDLTWMINFLFLEGPEPCCIGK